MNSKTGEQDERIRSDAICVQRVSNCLQRLREARARILQDAEAFHEAAASLEYVGQILQQKTGNGLSSYEVPLLELSRLQSAVSYEQTARLFDLVRRSRNDAVHEGAWARQHGTALVDLILILEESIVTKLDLVRDFMVQNPVIAEGWEMIAHVRRKFLHNSFSYLPIQHDDDWYLLSDAALAKYLRSTELTVPIKQRRNATIDAAVKSGHIKLAQATVCGPETTLCKVYQRDHSEPLLVIDTIGGQRRLVGIITPFDLL